MENKCDKVINLNTYSSINNTRCFFLDTNVLYWYTYPRFSLPGHLNPSAQIYYDFIDSLTSAGNPLKTSVYNLTELLNVVEKNEYDIYCKLHPDLPLSRKDFRRMAGERQKVSQMIKTTMNNALNICSITDFNFTSETLKSFSDEFTNHRCDVFDYAILKNCISTKDINIISDDGDFSSMPGINLYTANENILN